LPLPLSCLSLEMGRKLSPIGACSLLKLSPLLLNLLASGTAR
jgi:hypothetical protein